MKYIVEIVGDDELPGGMESVIVERDDEPPLLLLSGTVARCWSMMQAYEATLEPAWQPTISLPLAQHPLRLVV